MGFVLLRLQCRTDGIGISLEPHLGIFREIVLVVSYDCRPSQIWTIKAIWAEPESILPTKHVFNSHPHVQYVCSSSTRP